MIKGVASAIFLTALGLNYLNDMTKTVTVDKTLRFNDNGEFTILQFTDLHYGENDDDDGNNMMI